MRSGLLWTRDSAPAAVDGGTVVGAGRVIGGIGTSPAIRPAPAGSSAKSRAGALDAELVPRQATFTLKEGLRVSGGWSRPQH